jgi:DNA replication and repair protein RecF
MVIALNGLAHLIHRELSGDVEKLEIIYLPSIGEKRESRSEIEAEFRKALHQAREKEIAQGMSLVGPHRDDLGFEINGVNMSAYGSRSQQRTITLSLKLTEAKYIHDQTQDQPVLLLDDVLSELDQTRRHHLLGFISPFQQVLITTTDLDRLEPWFLSQATQFRVNQGNIERLSNL